MLLLAPVIDPQGAVRVLAEVAFSAMLILAVWTVSHNRRTTIAASLLAATVIMSNFLAQWIPVSRVVDVAILVGACAFFAYVTTLITWDIFQRSSVSLNTVIGAICVYVLIGVLWGTLYAIVDVLDPAAFPAAATDSELLARFVYFSMVTLTTLGYGDIVPLSALARGLAIVEATIGQVYLTVLVARLVGLHLSQQGAEEQ